jgi:hypothetical protein
LDKAFRPCSKTLANTPSTTASDVFRFDSVGKTMEVMGMAKHATEFFRKEGKQTAKHLQGIIDLAMSNLTPAFISLGSKVNFN